MIRTHSSDFLVVARDVAVEAALAAGRLIQHHAGRLEDDAVRAKGTHDLVTAVDEAAQTLIDERLLQAFPDHEVLGEEGADLEAEAAEATGYRWIVDPIDGTTNFAHGLPPYAVSIALQHHVQIVLGVVLDVSRGDLFTAMRSGGAFLNGRRLRVSGCERLDDALLTTGFPYRSFSHVDAYLEALRFFFQHSRGVRRPGVASIDLAYVAAGRFDAFFETGLNPWDIAAGLLLVEEAGGVVTDYRNHPNPIFRHQILATNGTLHAAMLEALAPMQDVTA